MNFSFSGGTAQQQAWASQAISQCTYPLAENVDANVTIEWGAFPNNADLKHPYMLTVPNGSSNFTIIIAPWADDPTNPNNQGLADPAAQLQEFYMNSVMHELGHVITYTTFDPDGADTDARIAQVCALFWTADPTAPGGKRFGTRDDWDAPQLSWGDEIREAVAEWIRLAFYSGPNLYGNRSNWQIDAANWSQLMALLSVSTTTTVTVPATPATTAHASVKVDFSSGTPPTPWGEGATLIMWIKRPTTGDYLIEAGVNKRLGGTFDDSTFAAESSYFFSDSDVHHPGAVNASIPYPVWIHILVDLSTGAVTAEITTDEAGASVVFSDSWSIDVSAGGPYACPTAALMSSEVELSTGASPNSGPNYDPSLGGSIADWHFTSDQTPSTDVNEQFGSIADEALYIPGQGGIGATTWTGVLHLATVGDAAAALRTAYPTSSTSEVVVDITVDSPYPFAPRPGTIAVGPGLRGAVRHYDANMHGRIPLADQKIPAATAVADPQSGKARGSAASPGLRGATKLHS